MGMQGAGSMNNPFMNGLVGGEYENPDRIFTGQITSLLTGGGSSGNNNGGYGNNNYGIESTCPEGVNQNTGKRKKRNALQVTNTQEHGMLEMVMSGNKKYREIDI